MQTDEVVAGLDTGSRSVRCKTLVRSTHADGIVSFSTWCPKHPERDQRDEAAPRKSGACVPHNAAKTYLKIVPTRVWVIDRTRESSRLQVFIFRCKQTSIRAYIRLRMWLVDSCLEANKIAHRCSSLSTEDIFPPTTGYAIWNDPEEARVLRTSACIRLQ